MAIVDEAQKYFDVRRVTENVMGSTVDVVSYQSKPRFVIQNGLTGRMGLYALDNVNNNVTVVEIHGHGLTVDGFKSLHPYETK